MVRLPLRNMKKLLLQGTSNCSTVLSTQTKLTGGHRTFGLIPVPRYNLMKKKHTIIRFKKTSKVSLMSGAAEQESVEAHHSASEVCNLLVQVN